MDFLFSPFFFQFLFFFPSFSVVVLKELGRSADISEDCVWRRCLGFKVVQVIPLH